jgi:hypothetical protein
MARRPSALFIVLADSLCSAAMRWLVGKLVAFSGTVLAAVAGASASQTLAFMHAYLQRLGGHLDEARRTLRGLQSGEIPGAAIEPAARDQLIESFERRIAELDAARAAIEQSGPFAKPFAFLAHYDGEIASATLKAFTRAVPLDLPSLVIALAAVALVWLLWEAGGGVLARRRARRTQ